MNTLTVEQIDDGITQVTLNRPERLNALTHELVGELHEALGALSVDRSCRVVILAGAGRGFCAGLDLKGSGEPPHSAEVGPAPRGLIGQQHIASLVPRLRAMPQPVIAAVNGPAAGGGFALALAADVRVAAASARFNVAFVRIGISGCDVGVSYLLPRLIGASRAFELLLTGRLIDAEEAERAGLVSRVVPDGEVVDAALEIAGEIRGNSPFGVWMTKETMWSNLEVSSLQAAIDLENRTQQLTAATEDHVEARTAWLERRDPEFRFG